MGRVQLEVKKYLEFVPCETFCLPPIWRVIERDGGEDIGSIHWDNHWSSFVFTSNASVTLAVQYMPELRAFITIKNKFNAPR